MTTAQAQVTPRAEPSAVARRIIKAVHRTSKQWGVLEPDDRIMLALSGGKDSYGMVELLHHMVPRLPFSVELVVVHLDQQQPGYDGAALKAWLDGRGYTYEILSEDTYSVVREHIPEHKTFCSLCSRLRRGILYTCAERLGCNKIALGHHRDDAIETFLLNAFFAGKLQAMPAKYTTDDGRFQVVRPLIEVAESDLVAFAQEQGFPIIPCNLCGSQEGLQRERVKGLLADLERAHPHVRSSLLAALKNVRWTHLLDPGAGPPGGQVPSGPPPEAARKTHFEATPVHRGLRILDS
jgi:tRNA 2-thiocytidine biosynthesis protein TtcA